MAPVSLLNLSNLTKTFLARSQRFTVMNTGCRNTQNSGDGEICVLRLVTCIAAGSAFLGFKPSRSTFHANRLPKILCEKTESMNRSSSRGGMVCQKVVELLRRTNLNTPLRNNRCKLYGEARRQTHQGRTDHIQFLDWSREI